MDVAEFSVVYIVCEFLNLLWAPTMLTPNTDWDTVDAVKHCIEKHGDWAFLMESPQHTKESIVIGSDMESSWHSDEEP